MVVPMRKPATFQDLLAREDFDRLEIVDGEIVQKASPSPRHSRAQRKLGAAVERFDGPPDSGSPGGWWLYTEIHVGYPDGELYCHDCAGWRRDRVPTEPSEWPVLDRPDWVCEIVSPKHERRDLVVKPGVLHAARVPHYWILDADERTLRVHRWSREGYAIVLRAGDGETVRAEPFGAIEMRVSKLFGDDRPADR